MDVTTLYSNIPREKGILDGKNFVTYQRLSWIQHTRHHAHYTIHNYTQQFRIQRAPFSSSQRYNDGNEHGYQLCEHIHRCLGTRCVEKISTSTLTIPHRYINVNFFIWTHWENSLRDLKNTSNVSTTPSNPQRGIPPILFRFWIYWYV